MRYLATGATVAALLLAMSAGSAVASPGHTNALDNEPADPPAANMPYAAPARAPAFVAYRPVEGTTKPAYLHSRANRLLHELAMDNHRINVDARHGYLTRAEAAKVKSERAAIRREVISTADAQGGILHRKQYRAMQERIVDLGQRIHRLSNNGVNA